MTANSQAMRRGGCWCAHHKMLLLGERQPQSESREATARVQRRKRARGNGPGIPSTTQRMAANA
eukprot:6645814-Alexandrium_andersonii.AAC.1